MDGANAVAMQLNMLDVTVLAVLGYAVVFFGLALLMVVVRAMGQAFDERKKN